MRNDDNGREEEAPLIEGTADASTMAKRKCAPLPGFPSRALRTVRLTAASAHATQTRMLPSACQHEDAPGLAGGCM